MLSIIAPPRIPTVVADYIAGYRLTGLSYEEIPTISDTVAVERIRTAKPVIDTWNSAAVVFFPYMVIELPRVGVTRELLWNEYRVKHPDGYECSQFCNLFKIWHGAESEAELFVAILGTIQYTYFEALRSQRKQDFITGNRNALEFFGGVPASIMPDCLKCAVSNAVDRSD
jgi:hypothetical protein